MNKKTIITVSILTLTAVLAGIAIFTALELQKNRSASSPTAPESNPSASESLQTAISCEPLTLIIGKIAIASPSASPIATGVPTATPKSTPKATNSPTPSATPKTTATASATPKATVSSSSAPTTQPELPDSGISTPTFISMAAGILLILIAASLAL